MWILAMNAFIADVTANPNDLAFRYGMLHLATSLGRPVAAPVGAYLFQTGGYVCVFSTSLCGTALGAAFLFWRIRSFKWNPPKKEGAIRTISKSAFSLSHISDCINTTFKKREGPNRKYILICMVMILMNVFVYIGEMVMDYNYVRTRYGWQVAEYSVYSSVISGASLIGTYSVAYNITVLYYNLPFHVGQAIVIPFVAYMKISESLVMIFLYVSFISRYVIKGFAEYSWMYYLGNNHCIPYSIIVTYIVTAIYFRWSGRHYRFLYIFHYQSPVCIVCIQYGTGENQCCIVSFGKRTSYRGNTGLFLHLGTN